MNVFKKYYTSCCYACDAEKCVIDQNEIEIPLTGKTNLSFRIFDLYSNSNSNFSPNSNSSSNSSLNSNFNQSDLSKSKDKTININKIETKIKRQQSKQVSKIQVFDDSLFSTKEKKEGTNRKGNATKQETNDNKQCYIFVENAFDIPTPQSNLLKNKKSVFQNVKSKQKKSKTPDAKKIKNVKQKGNNELKEKTKNFEKIEEKQHMKDKNKEIEMSTNNTSSKESKNSKIKEKYKSCKDATDEMTSCNYTKKKKSKHISDKMVPIQKKAEIYSGTNFEQRNKVNEIKKKDPLVNIPKINMSKIK